MGGRGAYSMSGGLSVSDSNGNDSVDLSKSRNFDYSDYRFDPAGVRLDDYQEDRRAEAAIIRFIADNGMQPGDVFDIPVETRKKGGSYSYTVRYNGDTIFDYTIIGRLRIR